MESKPKRATGYQPESVLRVRRTLLLIASKLGDLMDDIVVVGGLVPYLLVEQKDLPALRRHVGTMDLDLGLSLAILEDDRYTEVAERLRAEGFKPDQKADGKERRQTWVLGAGPSRVTVDFLIQPNNQGAAPGRITQIDQDLAAFTINGLDLAFQRPRKVSITDQMPNGSTLTRAVNVASAGAFVVLKAMAFRLRGENKDAYDLFYVLREVDRTELRADFNAFPADHPIVGEAVAILREDFITNSAGRAQAAEFIEGQRDEATEADVLAAVMTLLRDINF